MANKNPPAHDFAPAWLKIPTYNNYKPSGAYNERSGHTSRRDEHGYSRHGRDGDLLAPYHPYYSDCRREDFDDSYNNCYYGLENGFNGSSCSNQAFLNRRSHSRPDYRISLSYNKGDGSKHHMTKNGRGFYDNKHKGKHQENSTSTDGPTDGRGIGVTSNNFNQEFPSLAGDITEEPASPALNGSAWEKPRNIAQNTSVGKKTQLTKKPGKEDARSENSKKNPVSSTAAPLASLGNSQNASTPVAKGPALNCKALLLPAKITTQKKPLKEGSLKLTNKKSTPIATPTTHSMEILVKHPKAPGNKSEFLNTLRNAKKDQDDNDEDYGEKDLSGKHDYDHFMNGIEIGKLSCSDDKESGILSSSLEAEERLLREMGWNEITDEESFKPLTEDELQEFRLRSEKEMKKNGVRRNVLANLSPLRLTPFASVPPPTENSYSSSSDSDEA